LDGLGHGQDWFPAWFHGMTCFGVLLEMLYQLVVGIGPYSEAALGASYFFCHSYQNSRNTVCLFNTLYPGSFKVEII